MRSRSAPACQGLTRHVQDREDFTPYRFRIHIPGKDIIVDQYPTDLLGLLQKHGVTNPFEYRPNMSKRRGAIALTAMAGRLSP